MYAGLDVGGTHTDAVLLDIRTGRCLVSSKAPTRPGDVLPGVLEALQALFAGAAGRPGADPAAVRRLTVSTTLGLNALLTGSGDRVGMLVLPGPGLDPRLFWGRDPLFRVLPGAQDHRGRIIAEPSARDLAEAFTALHAHGAHAVGIVSKFSPKNPELERALAEHARREFGPGTPVVLGSQAGGTLDFPRRLHTVWCNAGLAAVNERFLRALQNALEHMGLTCPLAVLKADAGSFTAEEALHDPASSMGSGPAASLLGVWALTAADRQVTAASTPAVPRPGDGDGGDGGNCNGCGGSANANASRSASRSADVSTRHCGSSFAATIPDTDQNTLPDTNQDMFMIDMGGTSTDIALLAGGSPLLARKGLTVAGRPTLIRTLWTHSLALGGDSSLRVAEGAVRIGPDRSGPALALGADPSVPRPPTLTDALNVLGLATLGDTRLSSAVLAALARDPACPAGAAGDPPALARLFVRTALERVAEAAGALLDEVNSRPVYTIRELLVSEPLRPACAVFIGGPAASLATEAERALGLPVFAPAQSAWANALGAALALPTKSAELYADTLLGRMSIPEFSLAKAIGRDYSLPMAEADLLAAFAAAGTDPGDVQTLYAERFAMLDDRGRRGRTIRLRAQRAAGLAPLGAMVPADPLRAVRP